jgi:hypothetical protein
MRLAIVAVLFVLTAGALALGCALGPEQAPGCHSSADCDPGFTCTEGACFRTTTDRTEPADGGADADAAGDAG